MERLGTAMKIIEQHPALVLASLGVLSGYLGTLGLDFGFGEAPDLGIYMIHAGILFGLVVAFGVWTWGKRSWTSAAVPLLATWVAWEAAVNIGLQLESNWLKDVVSSDTLRAYMTGSIAGAVGALLMWGGAAVVAPVLQRWSTAVMVVATGAVLGLLMQATNNYDSPAILLVPWQAGVAAMLGLGLAPARKAHHAGTIAPVRNVRPQCRGSSVFCAPRPPF
jgi:hypothetical protein